MAKKARAVKSGFRFATLQMFSGALATGLISLMFEKPWAIDWTQVSDRSWLAFWYLAIFGSVIAFTAFSWISRNAEPHLVATYALVNPLIAVALGWFFYNEVVTMKFALATVLVLIGLSLLIFNGKFKYLKLRTKT